MALMLRAKAAASVAAHSTARAFSTNVFANYSVFDGDIVMNVRPAFPRFTQRSYGWTMNRRGGIAFEFSQRKPEGGGFDWDNRATFVLDLPEVGEFAVDQADPLKFVHNVNHSDGTSVTKTFKVSPNSDDGTVEVLLKFTSSEGEATRELSVSMTEGNFHVIKTLMFSAIPSLSGWSMVLDPSKFDAARHAEKTFEDRE